MKKRWILFFVATIGCTGCFVANYYTNSFSKRMKPEDKRYFRATYKKATLTTASTASRSMITGEILSLQYKGLVQFDKTGAKVSGSILYIKGMVKLLRDQIGHFRSVWSFAIKRSVSNRDIGFNTALRIVVREFRRKGVPAKLSKAQALLKAKIMKNKTNKGLRSAYGSMIQLIALAQVPTGSLRGYVRNANRLILDIRKSLSVAELDAKK